MPTTWADGGRHTTGPRFPTRNPTSSISWLSLRRAIPGYARRALRYKSGSRTTWDNLTLAAPTLNRYEKVAKDAAEWQPEHNLCWFAGRVLAVKLEYGLTVNPQEAAALDAMLEGCRIEQVLRPYRPEPSP